MGLPVRPQDLPCLSSLSQKDVAFFLNAGLVGNLCGLAVRKQKLIIHISGPEELLFAELSLLLATGPRIPQSLWTSRRWCDPWRQLL